jgi:uncharacterized protein YjgD (DUF1641 family)
MSEVLPPGPAREASPEIEALVDRLQDPRVASGLQNLLDHVDLLAILVIGLDGFVGRSELIGEALVEGVSDIRELADAADVTGSVDIAGTVSSLVAVASMLPKLTPVLTRMVDEDVVGSMLDSGIFSPDSLAHIGLLATAVNRGATDAVETPIQVKGAYSMLRQLKDPDVARGLGYTLSILKAVGRELAADQQKGQ